MCFWKHFISYLCMWFIKFNTLRNLCIILLCFSKNWFFQNFDRLNLFFDRSKLRLKCLWASVYFDRCSIGVGSIEAFSTNRICFSIDRKLFREFFKNWFHVFKHTFSKVLQLFLSLYNSVKAPIRFFVIFHHTFCKVFLSQGR